MLNHTVKRLKLLLKTKKSFQFLMSYCAHPIHQMGRGVHLSHIEIVLRLWGVHLTHIEIVIRLRGGPLQPCGNSSSSVVPYFQENLHSSKIELDLEAFEDHVLTEGHNLKDVFSCSSNSESTDLSSCDRIDRIVSNASKELDRLTNEILCLDFKEKDFTSEHEDIFNHVLVEPLP